MNGADVILGLFAAFNAVRVLAYVPQILRAVRDRDGARAISCWFFAASHLSTVGYALVIVADWHMASIFATNAACCGLIVGITLCRRLNLDSENDRVEVRERGN